VFTQVAVVKIVLCIGEVQLPSRASTTYSRPLWDVML
jgi:hypothetical protein